MEKYAIAPNRVPRTAARAVRNMSGRALAATSMRPISFRSMRIGALLDSVGPSADPSSSTSLPSAVVIRCFTDVPTPVEISVSSASLTRWNCHIASC